MYLDGEGVPRDLDAAIRLFRRAGAAGDANALFFLGQLFWTGTSVQRDAEKAAVEFGGAFKLGHPKAMNALGIAHRIGDGVEQSNAHAFAYFSLASELGDGSATENLAKLSPIISEEQRIQGRALIEQFRREIMPKNRFTN